MKKAQGAMEDPFTKGAPLCHECKAKMVKKKFKIEGLAVRGWECPKCSENLLHPSDAQKVLLINKLRQGIPVRVGKLGQNLMVRFPKEIANFYHLKPKETVTLKVEDTGTLAVEISQ